MNLTRLMRLQLDGNNFIGKIPEVLSNCSSLEDSDAKAQTPSFTPTPDGDGPRGKEETIPFTTKNVSYLYREKFSHTCPELIFLAISLQQIESLDLSYNNLNGKIPPQLVGLHSLSFFSVAHNNLSGKTPETDLINLEPLEEK
ncbi:hypothetical protein Patl1_14699 [Pistacia atlantica]|uniref:Uncharacterized protein n=1 Tax=Pistacia atlantica TaxID=434234 RepID=A0ACC1AV02_9ROSI|nr:hypothetical protein Patl1_14699 [Pistacia atlantica]